MSLGFLMVDIEGTTLTAQDREVLTHPLVGGVILFSRNYESPAQLTALVTEIHQLRTPSLMVAVDHEGGRVQRFRDKFTALPAAGVLGKLYDDNPAHAVNVAEQVGWVLGAELRQVGVDISFAPVLDIAAGVSEVIGDRAYHTTAKGVTALATAVLSGMQRSGLIGVGKHFPGHGSVVEDSHHAVPVDNRSFAAIETQDLVPFAKLIKGGLPAIMPAHVIYPYVDKVPAGFSSVWLQQILRQHLRFEGVIFSDDVTMAGAAVAGTVSERVIEAWRAGCDMVLICNNRPAVEEALTQVRCKPTFISQIRLTRLLEKRPAFDNEALQRDLMWLQAKSTCMRLSERVG